MNMEIKIDKVAVEAAVTQAIIDSSIGDIIRTAIKERLQDYKLREAIGRVIDQQISVIVRDLLMQEDNCERMRAEIHAQFTDAMFAEIVGRATAKIWQ